jgi:hypothetical protein
VKPQTIPFTREIHPGAAPGEDIRAIKRALAVANATAGGMDTKTGAFGPAAQQSLIEFKLRVQLLGDPIYTTQAHTELTPWFDSYGAALMSDYLRREHALALRAAYVSTLNEMIVRRVPANYAEVRPIPVGAKRMQAGLTTDCSGSVTLAARWTDGCPDPSGGTGFQGWANTSTILGHSTHPAISNLLPGDLIVYRASLNDGYGHHVVAVLDVIGNGDYHVFSHGHPGDPEKTTHGAMAHSQAAEGFPVATGCQFLPRP